MMKKVTIVIFDKIYCVKVLLLRNKGFKTLTKAMGY